MENKEDINTLNLISEEGKVWKMPVTWEVYSTVEIRAKTLEEALIKFRETQDEISLPLNGEYVDDSFDLSDNDIDYIALFNEDNLKNKID